MGKSNYSDECKRDALQQIQVRGYPFQEVSRRLGVSSHELQKVENLFADPAPKVALFNTAIDRKLRGCNLVRMTVRDVYAAGSVRERTSIMQSKTGKPVRFEISETSRQSLQRWIDEPDKTGAELLWPSRIHGSPYLSARQYARMMRAWVTCMGLEPSGYGNHSMRRTKVARIYRKTGNLRAVQLLLGHKKRDSAVRYLGIDLEDALSLSETIVR